MIYQFAHNANVELARHRRFFTPALVPALAFAILALIVDLNTPRGVADGFLYVLAVLTCFWLPNPNSALYAAAMLMPPMALGIALSPLGAPILIEATNRILGVLTIWITATLIRHNARLTDERNRLLADRVQQDRNKEDFLAALGHELRNPMAAIQFSLRLIHADDPPTRRALALLRRQSQHMAYLIGDLFDISRISHGKIALERKIIDLNQSALDTTEQMREQVEAKGLALELTLAAQPVHIDADPERIAQILDNLLRNALTYTHTGGITVTVGTATGQASIAIRDTGEGIARDEAATLFDPFQQATYGAKRGGLGLGLTLVRQLIEMHGGTVALHSDGPGAGSEFLITIPLVRAREGTDPTRVRLLSGTAPHPNNGTYFLEVGHTALPPGPRRVADSL